MNDKVPFLKRFRQTVPMKKGAALLTVRSILGPTGHVRFAEGHSLPCIVGTFGERWNGIASGKDWKTAIADLRASRKRRSA